MSDTQWENVADTVASVVRGKRDAIELSLITLLARGHLLIEDIPGVGKTTLAHSLATVLGCGFQRIQFTSDLLPSDILGVNMFNQKSGEFEFRPGPIFSNVLLADEINRTTPKTQSALLEAMNESQVTIDGYTHTLPHPFMVVATQNPLEFHGTFPLPENQLDRFLLSIHMGYPDVDAERAILREQQYAVSRDGLPPMLSPDDVLGAQKQVDAITVSDALVDYVLAIIDRTRHTPAFRLGVSPRGTLALKQAAAARAFLHGREYALPDDVKALAAPVLAHRVILAHTGADQEGRVGAARDIIADIVQQTPVPN